MARSSVYHSKLLRRSESMEEHKVMDHGRSRTLLPYGGPILLSTQSSSIEASVLYNSVEFLTSSNIAKYISLTKLLFSTNKLPGNLSKSNEFVESTRKLLRGNILQISLDFRLSRPRQPNHSSNQVLRAKRRDQRP